MRTMAGMRAHPLLLYTAAVRVVLNCVSRGECLNVWSH